MSSDDVDGRTAEKVDEKSSSSLAAISDQIEELYRFRDAYFTAVPEDQFSLKNSQIESKLKNILSTMEDDSLRKSRTEDPVRFSFLKARLLNIRTEYDQEVKELLTKAVKLKPNDTTLWNELGECYRKKDDFKMALTCFETALKNCPQERDALRSASIMLRSLPTSSAEERKSNVMRSVELAKKALEGNLNDGASWVVLANAYLTLLFSSSRWEVLKAGNLSLLRSAKSAYQKALLDSQVATKADVLFNYASVLQYEEDFETTLRYLRLAFKYDSEWRELESRRQHLITFLGDIAQKRADASLLKSKKLNSLKEKLATDEERLQSRYADDEDLCCGTVRRLADLQEGENECLFASRVISYSTDSSGVFLAAVFTVIDAAGASAALFIYDIDQRKGPRAGDSVVIVRPVFRRHQIDIGEGDGKLVEFEAIKVVRPLADVYVNGRRLNVGSLSTPVVNVTLKSD